MKQIVLKFAIVASLACLSSCFLLYGPMGGNMGFMATTPDYRVELIECRGYHSAQMVTATLMITNRNANTRAWVGGSPNSYAIDDQGRRSQPYSSSGVLADLPTGVPVRVTIERIQPVFHTTMFRHLQISIGGGDKNRVTFRNVPIIWE